MKRLFSAASLILATGFAPAAILEFDLSPPGTSPGDGLSPANEVITGFSIGSGNEIDSGIVFDTSSLLLTFSIGYGSAAGFSDLTTPAFAWLWHGGAPVGETAPAIMNLAGFHTFAPDPARGGWLQGSFTLSAPQAADLLSSQSYINIYTPANLGGELRGQLVLVPEVSSGALLISAGALALIFHIARRSRRELPV